MPLDPTRNFAKVTVSTGYDAAATSIDLVAGDGAKLPDPATDGAFNLTWWNETDYKDPTDDPNKEIVRCTARTGDTLTITRGQEGTTATAKNLAGKTYKMVLAMTKKMKDDIESFPGSDKEGRIAALTEKIAPVNADLLMIEDSAAANAKKKIQIGNLPGAGGITTGWEKVAEITATSNVQELSATGLDLDAAKAYQFVFIWYNPLAATVYLQLMVNADTTVTNYYRGTSVAGGYGSANDATIGENLATSGSTYFGIMTRPPTDGRPHATGKGQEAYNDVSWAWRRQIAGNVTSIQLRTITAGGIGTGSKLIIFKITG